MTEPPETQWSVMWSDGRDAGILAEDSARLIADATTTGWLVWRNGGSWQRAKDGQKKKTAPDNPTPTLTLSEVFGPTVQGEGASLGRRCSFIRLGGCNLTCSWCDTPYTWDASRYDLRKELKRWTVQEILDKVLVGDPERIVISGGEPLLQQTQPGWLPLLAALREAGKVIEVETNGTVTPTSETTRLVSQFNVSPKLAHGGDPEHKRIVPGALAALKGTGKAEFKFVCQTMDDVDDVSRLAVVHGLPPNRVWIMPEGTDAATATVRLEALAGPAIAHGFNVTTRLHVLAWGPQRGR